MSPKPVTEHRGCSCITDKSHLCSTLLRDRAISPVPLPFVFIKSLWVGQRRQWPVFSQWLKEAMSLIDSLFSWPMKLESYFWECKLFSRTWWAYITKWSCNRYSEAAWVEKQWLFTWAHELTENGRKASHPCLHFVSVVLALSSGFAAILKSRKDRTGR
jgi:hypothetical protein